MKVIQLETCKKCPYYNVNGGFCKQTKEPITDFIIGDLCPLEDNGLSSNFSLQSEMEIWSKSTVKAVNETLKDYIEESRSYSKAEEVNLLEGVK